MPVFLDLVSITAYKALVNPSTYLYRAIPQETPKNQLKRKHYVSWLGRAYIKHSQGKRTVNPNMGACVPMGTIYGWLPWAGYLGQHSRWLPRLP